MVLLWVYTNNVEGENIIQILKKQGYEVVLLSADGLTQEYGIRKNSLKNEDKESEIEK